MLTDAMLDLHCAGCGAITSIPPLCGPCFKAIDVRSPIVASTRKGYDYAVRIEGCVQHLTRDDLATFVRNSEDLAS